ncbi:MAG: fumarylacetoacetate hydrolase family protein [Pseudomonadota bacterium]
MKLVRYGDAGHEKPGLLDTAGRVRDLSGLVEDIHPRLLSPAGLRALRAVDADLLPVVAGSPRMGMPWTGAGKFIAVGLNYLDHANEAGMAVPKEPILFTKAITCLQGPDDDVVLPLASVKTDWEVELGVVIGSTARNVSQERALDHVAGYCVVNDVSEREWQIERSNGQWDKGKGFDTFGPVGPALVTADEVPDPQALRLWLDVNGERMQTGSTATMIFPVAHLVSYISRFITLMPGDLIATGTPPGVGMGMKPPKFLRAGDEVALGIEGLGTQRQKIVDRARSSAA